MTVVQPQIHVDKHPSRDDPYSVLEASEFTETIVTTGDINDLVSVDQTNDDSSRILDRNYSSSTNESKTITPGSCVASPQLKSNLNTQDINKMYYQYYPNMEEKESSNGNLVDEEVNEIVEETSEHQNDVEVKSQTSPEVFKFDKGFDPSQPHRQLILSEKSPIARYQKKRGSSNGTPTKLPMKETYFISPTSFDTSTSHDKSKSNSASRIPRPNTNDVKIWSPRSNSTSMKT